jgi:hypothetical protein
VSRWRSDKKIAIARCQKKKVRRIRRQQAGRQGGAYAIDAVQSSTNR